jgi:DMSO/TMAO reductase YedYZ molybdopterin-dependent catalytic subunit
LSKTVEARKAGTLIPTPDITPEELQLAVRNHSMPLEALHYPITPIGLHYLLIHFDIPVVDAATWELSIGGQVERPLRLSLDDIRSRPQTTIAVTLECAGNGRARLSPRPMSQPWLSEAVGTAEWTGTPLGPILAEAGLGESAREVVFTGIDRGVQGGIDQLYERSLPLAEAQRPEVMLVHAINGQALPPQHGFPVRLIVPGWYGMTHVKWLRSITVTDAEFEGYQQARAYHYRVSDLGAGEPVTRMLPRALMVPPGVPDFMSRTRFVTPGTYTIEGRAWSGLGTVTRVDFSDDGGRTWAEVELGAAVSPFAWRGWRHDWKADPGEHELCVRATDSNGNVQPDAQSWNLEGVQNNATQRVRVVANPVEDVQTPADE